MSDVSSKYKILLGSPVHQKPKILKEFLISLGELNLKNIDLHFCFVDDNSDEDSSELLSDFKNSTENVMVLPGDNTNDYVCDDYTHHWDDFLVKKVTRFKNKIIEIAIEKSYDYLFFIDSDIILHPNTIIKLIHSNKDIISNVFWTKWGPNSPSLPQVWLMDAYTMCEYRTNNPITQGEMQRKTQEFLEKLKRPGTYRVGGLGACTLISKNALLKGVNFNDIYNLSFWGEDRYFCIRAVALGFELFVDTHYPAYHIYRIEDLDGVEKYKLENMSRDEVIEKFNVKSSIEKTLTAVDIYSYRDSLLIENSNYMTEKFLEKMNNARLELKPFILENHLVQKAQVKEYELIQFNDSKNSARAKFRLSLEGFIDYKSYYKEYYANCTLKLIDDVWKVNNYALLQEINYPQGKILRIYKEEPTLTLSMIVKGESHKYIEKSLAEVSKYIDNAIIIDDGSCPDSKAIYEKLLKDIPYRVIEKRYLIYHNETELRKYQWDETMSTNPDWVLFLDGDDIFEDKFKDNIKMYMDNIFIDVYLFRLFDFWNETHYRDDQYWNAHNNYYPFLIRYQPNFHYQWKENCGRTPININLLSNELSPMRIKHYGWSTAEDRLLKYNRYIEMDPNEDSPMMSHYKSIIDKNPNLVKWKE